MSSGGSVAGTFDGDEVTSLISHLHALAADQRGALEARLKHMQRLGFPRLHKDRRGTRIKYTFEDIVLIALAFRIMETGVASPRAYDLVTRSNTVIAVAFEQAWQLKAARGKNDVLLSYRPHVFSAELGRSAVKNESAIGGPLEPAQTKRQARAGTAIVNPLQVVINISDIANRLRSALKVLGRSTTDF